MKFTAALLMCLCCAVTAQNKPGAQSSSTQSSITQTNGIPSNGFPQWSERVLLEWTNRARSDPQYEMNQCGSACGDAACYQPIAPLLWSLNLNRSARFHSDEMVQQGYFAHDSACTLVSNIDSLYPASCNGAASCACVGGTQTCNTVCTNWSSRIGLFGESASAENLSAFTDPNSAFYQWLYENYPTVQTPPTCLYDQGPPTNGHRWNLLMLTGTVGFGDDGPVVGDFSGAAGTASKIPSGAHYPQQAASVTLWANWYDTSGPAQANVVVDGWPVAMSLARGTQLNGVWSATANNVGNGCHRYFFDFKDSTNTSVQYPDTGSFAIGSGNSCPDYSSTRPAATSTSLVSSAPIAEPGSNVTFTATVTSSTAGTPTGSVTFFDGATSLGISALNGSAQAALTTSALSLGTHTITAFYSGDTSYAADTSPAVTQTIVSGLAILPNPVNFTSVAVGSKTAAVKVTVSNQDSTSIAINSVGITGTNASDFVISSTTCTAGLTLASGKSCTVSIYFHPSAAGGRTALLSIANTGPSNPQTAPLNGTGLNVDLTPNAVNYGTVLVGSNVTKKITLKNTSTSTLNISNISASGDYSVASQTCAAQLSAGSSCAINVTFHPLAKDVRNGTLSVSDDGIGSPQTAALTGKGTYISFSPASVNFGSVVQGSNSAQNVTLTNHNSVTVNITRIAITGTNAGDFAIVSGNTSCGTSVPAGQSCVIALQFNAGTLGTRSASLSLSDDGGASPQLVPLKASSAIHPVINEFMTAGTAGGGDEFVELYNPNSFAFSLSGYRLVYRGATASSDTVLVNFPSTKSIPAGGYVLVAGPTFSGVTPDFRYSNDTLSPTAGGVAIRDSAGNIIDSVGYGATSNFVETAAAPVPPSGESSSRLPNGTDTNNNSLDFSVTAVPTPKAPN